MFLPASCLLFVLLPQEPAPSAPPPAPAATTSAADDATTLAALEKAGDKADRKELARLATEADAAIATRAAWLLAKGKDRAALELLRGVVAGSPHADARAHAMHAVAGLPDVGSTTIAVTALRDADRRVRTLAAQLLGKLKRPTAVEPLLALIDESRTQCAPGPATDLQAALLALHDLGAAEHLLRAATALHDSKAEGTGEALAFCCQDLGSKLPKAEQVTFLLAVLAHREPLVRRYAIGRLAELEDPATAKALEGRLATEGDELRPLVEMALAQIRKEKLTPPSDELARATQNLRALAWSAQSRWQQLDTTQQALVGAAPVVLLLAIVLLLRSRRKRAAAAEAAATIALVAPSEEFAAQAAAEAELLASEVDTYTDDEPIEEEAGTQAR